MFRNIKEILTGFSPSSLGILERSDTPQQEVRRKLEGAHTLELLNSETASIFSVLFVDSSLISSY